MKVKNTLFLSIITLMLTIGAPVHAAEKVYVFAAASTTNAVKELISSYQQESNNSAEYLTSFASSSTLAKQIDAGADANIFISANVKWYNWLTEKGLAEADTHFIMASNALVVIAGPDVTSKLDDIAQLPSLLQDSRLAMGDYQHVPAGAYGKEALETSNIWDSVKDSIASYNNVRVVLNAVDKGQVDYGIVYKTDAAQSRDSHIIYTFAPQSHTPIEYPICAIKGKKTAETEKFLAFLKTDKAKSILEKYGFVAQ